MPRHTAVLLAFLVCGNVNALSVGPLDESVATAHADSVAEVEVVKARELKVSGSTCGSRYLARLHRQIKGRSGFLGKVEFNSWDGYKVGDRLRVFLLRDHDKFVNELVLERGLAAAEDKALIAACRRMWGSAGRGFAVVRLAPKT